MQSASVSFVFRFLLLSAFLAPPSMNGQWSSDPDVNLQVCDVTGEQVLPKIANARDGGTYISWFDHRSSGYAVYLQKLDSLGVKQFSPDGLLISAHPQSSSLVDYDLAVDDSNNAIIVFTDTRDGGSINPFAYKISPAGGFLWGPNGVTLSDTTAVFQPNPKVAPTSDGGSVIVWVYSSTPNKIAMQKLSPDGVKLWGSRPVLLSGVGIENLTYPSLVRSDSGSVIMLWSGYTGSFLNPGNYRLYTQKFSSAGAPVWSANPDTVYSLGRITGFFVPKIFSDGNDGAFYVWQDDRNFENKAHSYLQYFTSNGTPVYPLNGSAGSTSTSTNQFDAWMAYMPLTGEAYMFWKESNDLQSQFAIYGQRFSSTGGRLWIDSGLEFKPFGSNSTINQICFASDTNVMVFFNEGIFGSADNLIRGFVTDRNGVMGWGGTILAVSSRVSGKSKIVGAIDVMGMTKVAWSDDRNDAGGIYVQNVNSDGTLGNPAVGVHESAGQPEQFVLFQNYPNPFNPSTTIRFEIPRSGHVALKVFDVLGREVATLVDGEMKSGSYEKELVGGDLSTGLYLIRLVAGGRAQTMKALLLK